MSGLVDSKLIFVVRIFAIELISVNNSSLIIVVSASSSLHNFNLLNV